MLNEAHSVAMEAHRSHKTDTDKFMEGQLQALSNLCSKAMSLYALKDYDAAAVCYAHASELQAQIRGEMSTLNAEVLCSYGRSLFQVALKKSDVLGTRACQDEQPTTSLSKESATLKSLDATNAPEASTYKSANTPKQEAQLFTFQGDENWDSEDENKSASDDDSDGQDEEEDDFATAFEVLDLARVLYIRRITENEAANDDVKWPGEIRKIEEQLSDIYDLQAEIQLEAENFRDAVESLRQSLKLKVQLFPISSSLVAEAHFKLSLALEFLAGTSTENTDVNFLDGDVSDHSTASLRQEAASEMESAIRSCQMRIDQEKNKLENNTEPLDHEDSVKLRSNISSVESMIKEMDQRLLDLRQTPQQIENFGATHPDKSPGALASLLGDGSGASSAVLAGKLRQAMHGANDLTSLVKKKKATGNDPQAASTVSHKRKADVLEPKDDDGLGNIQ